MKFFSSFLIFFIFCLLWGEPIELLRNGHFPSESTGKPEQWSINAGTIELIPQAGRNGSGALRIVFAKNSWGYTLATTAQCAHKVHKTVVRGLPGVPHAIYRFELWAKGSGRTNFVISLFAGNKHLRTISSPYLLLSNSYRKLEFSMCIPDPDFTGFTVGVSAMRDSTVVLDQVSVTFDPAENPNIAPGFDLPRDIDSQALKTPVFAMPFASRPPVTDGMISEGEYDAGTGIERLFPYKKSALLKVENSYRVASDGKMLYIAMRSELSPDGSLVGLKNEPIGPGNLLKNQDALEIVIDPSPDGEEDREIFQGIFNFSSPVYTKCYRGKVSEDWALQCLHKSRIDGRHWEMEVAIPLDQLNLDREALTRGIGLRICRNWSNLRSGNPASQLGVDGKAYIDPATMPRFSWRDGIPGIHHTALTGEESTSPGLRIELSNSSKETEQVKLFLKLTPQFSGETALNRVVEIAPGEKKIVSLRSVGMPGEIIYGQIDVLSQENVPLYRRNFFFQLQRGKSEFIARDDYADAMRLAYSPTENAVALEFNLHRIFRQNGDAGKDIQLTLRRVDDPEKIIAENRIGLRSDGRAWLDFWKLPELKDGEYLVEAQVSSDSLKPLTASFTRKTFPWQGNQIGKSPVLPPRFTALQQNGMEVECVLRRYSFTSLGLPEQIVAAGKKLLKSPAVLFGKIDGEDAPVEGISFQWTAKSPLECRGEGIYKWGTRQGKFRMKMEYDGLVSWEFDLPDGVIESLKLELPICSETATLYHAVGDGIHHHYSSGELPPGMGEIWRAIRKPGENNQSAFAPYLWVGGELRGLAICSDSDRNYANLPDTPAQKIVRTHDSVKIINQFISQRIHSREGKTLTIQYQATPVKPMAKDWRLKTIGFFEPSGKENNYLFLLNSTCWGAETDCDDVEPRNGDMSFLDFLGNTARSGELDEAFLRKWNQGYGKMLETVDSPPDRRKMQQRFIFATGTLSSKIIARIRPDHLLFYTNSRGLRLGKTEARIFMDEWSRTRFMDREWNYGASNSYILDPVESYRDYAAWHFSRMQKHLKFHFYIDDVFPSAAESTLVTEAWRLADGTLHPSFGIRNMREWVRRATVLSIENGIEEPFTLTHMTNTAVAPIIGMGYAQIGWEFFKMGCRPCQERFTRGHVRALNIGRQFGNVPFGLVTLTRDGTKADWDWAKRTGSGVALTHEVKLFSWFEDGQATSNMHYQKTLAELMKFGYGRDGVTVYNYWEENYPLKIENIDSSSILLAKDDSAIVIVCDWKEGGNACVIPDPSLGYGEDFTALDQESGEVLDVRGGKISFPLKKYDYKIILIRKK